MTVDSIFLRSIISYFYRRALYDDDEPQNLVNAVIRTLQQVGSSVHHFPPPCGMLLISDRILHPSGAKSLLSGRGPRMMEVSAFFTLKMSFQKSWAKVTKLLKETIQMNEDLGVKLRPKSLINSNSNHEAYANCEKA